MIITCTLQNFENISFLKYTIFLCFFELFPIEYSDFFEKNARYFIM